MSFQQIRGGKSFGIALEMFEYFKSGKINCANGHDAAGDYVQFMYIPAGTSIDHFTRVALALSGGLCEIRNHAVESEVPEIDYQNRKQVEFFIKHEHDNEMRFVRFKLTLVQPCAGGVWCFLGAELIDSIEGQTTTTRYAMRESIPHLRRPHLDWPRDIAAPGIHNTWWILGMNCPIYMVSQEVSGERRKEPTTLQMMEQISESHLD